MHNAAEELHLAAGECKPLQEDAATCSPTAEFGDSQRRRDRGGRRLTGGKQSQKSGEAALKFVAKLRDQSKEG